jgi:hypothetical protein
MGTRIDLFERTATMHSKPTLTESEVTNLRSLRDDLLRTTDTWEGNQLAAIASHTEMLAARNRYIDCLRGHGVEHPILDEAYTKFSPLYRHRV